MIERYPFHERICHWLTGFAYLYCLATGLAFYSPYLFWLAVILGGGPTSRFWHPLVGVASSPRDLDASDLARRCSDHRRRQRMARQSEILR